jgi:dolichol-phosphate mannosyltransferase
VSKMSGSNIREAVVKVAQWGIAGRLNRRSTSFVGRSLTL